MWYSKRNCIQFKKTTINNHSVHFLLTNISKLQTISIKLCFFINALLQSKFLQFKKIHYLTLLQNITTMSTELYDYVLKNVTTQGIWESQCNCVTKPKIRTLWINLDSFCNVEIHFKMIKAGNKSCLYFPRKSLINMRFRVRAL